MSFLLDRALEAPLRLVVIARQERHPGPILLHPRAAAGVAGRDEQRLRLAEEPLGIGQRTTEDLGVPALTKRLGEVDIVLEEYVDRSINWSEVRS